MKTKASKRAKVRPRARRKTISKKKQSKQDIFTHIEEYRKSCEGATGRRPSSNGKGPTHGEARIAQVNKLELLLREPSPAGVKLRALLRTMIATGNKQWSFRPGKYYPLAGPVIQHCLDHKLITQEEADVLKCGRARKLAPVATTMPEEVQP